MERGAYVAPDSFVEEHVKFVVRRYARINGAITVKGGGTVEIGQFCAMGGNIRVVTKNHTTNGVNLQEIVQKMAGAHSLVGDACDVTIGPNCWIGDYVMILPGVSLPAGCVVGAGAVLVPHDEGTEGAYVSFGIYVGNPARLVRRRFDTATCDRLMHIAWWDWSVDKIKAEKEFFDLNLDLEADRAKLVNYLP